jgi:nucleotide-binding universal stress UspA family protein
MPRSIVVGTDGSEPAGAAVRRATDMASREGVRLHLVTAYPDPQMLRERMTGAAHAETIDLREVADAVLKRAAHDAGQRRRGGDACPRRRPG